MQLQLRLSAEETIVNGASLSEPMESSGVERWHSSDNLNCHFRLCGDAPEPSLFLAFDGNPVTAALGRGQDKGRNMENGKWENCPRSTYNGEKVR